MKQNIKKELLYIVENAELNKETGEYVYRTETGIYHFRTPIHYAGKIDDIKKRIASLDKKVAEKNPTYKTIQKKLKILSENKHLIQVLFDVRYLMREHGMNATQAMDLLFKDKKKLPDGIIKRISYKASHYYEVKKEAERVDWLLSELDTLPKEWLKKY